MKYPHFGLRIHCWGGLGSQLFAANLAFDIQAKFQKKNITIVLHSGGVTERLPELPEVFPNFNYEIINDFSKKKPTQISSINVSRSLRKMLSNVLNFFRLVVTLNDDDTLSSFKYWTIAVRGHYSYRAISHEFLEKFYKSVNGREFQALDTDSISLHYRLGDLMSLEEKGPIDNRRIVEVIHLVGDRLTDAHLELYSDSPHEALLLLANSDLDFKISVREQLPLQLIVACSNSKYFVGTSSKISFWVALVRSEILKKDSYLPREKKDEFRWLSRTEKLIHYY
jgi:hypothetical protein